MFEKEKQELELAEQRLRQRSLDIVSNILKQSDEKIIEDAKSCYSLNEFRKFNYKILKEEDCFWGVLLCFRGHLQRRSNTCLV